MSRQPVVHSALPPKVGWDKYLREISHPPCGGSGWKGNHYEWGEDPSEQGLKPGDWREKILKTCEPLSVTSFLCQLRKDKYILFTCLFA